MDFAKVAPYLQDPLILIGFIVFLGFSFSRYLIKQKIIPELPPKLGFSILKIILLYGFIIGILIVSLGFGLKYKELSKSEQMNAFKLLRNELKHNLYVASELTKNMENILSKQKTIAEVLRIEGIKIFPIVFPIENTHLKPQKSVQEMVDLAFDTLASSDIIHDDLEMNKFNAAGKQINSTIENTVVVLRSLQDEKGVRYVIKNDIWQSNLPIYRMVNTFDVILFQDSLEELEKLRTNYSITIVHAIDYLETVKDFFKPGNTITRQQLYKVLSKERFSLEMTLNYSSDLIVNSEKLKLLESKLM